MNTTSNTTSKASSKTTSASPVPRTTRLLLAAAVPVMAAATLSPPVASDVTSASNSVVEVQARNGGTQSQQARLGEAGTAQQVNARVRHADSRPAPNGHRLRLTVPKRVEPGTQFEAHIGLTSIVGSTPKVEYRRFRLLASTKGEPWKVVRRTAVTRKFAYDFTLTAPSVRGGYRLKLEALRRNGQRPLVMSPVRVQVEPPKPVDLGDPNDWTSISGKNADGTPYRWDPCAPIRWTLNPHGTEAVYPQALADVSTSLERIAAYTGLTFTYAGSTTVIPYATDGGLPYPSDDAPDLFIGFASKSEVPAFTQGVIGLGGPAYYRADIDSKQWIDTGGVVLNAALVNSMDPLDESSRVVLRSLIMHEVLHAVGLGHANGKQQIMYPFIQESETFGAGDITGMTVHGAAGGCPSGYPERPRSFNARTFVAGGTDIPVTGPVGPLSPVAHTASDLPDGASLLLATRR